jgi:uncharacterized membrane protein (UPF0136 family)
MLYNSSDSSLLETAGTGYFTNGMKYSLADGVVSGTSNLVAFLQRT